MVNRVSRLQPVVCVATVIGLMIGGGCRQRATSIDESAAEDFQLGNLIEPFTPPSLEQLEADVAASGGWLEGEVLDSLELLREKQATETPLATAAEALQLRNDSAENNAIILSALGRLPQSDGDVNFDAEISRHTLQALKSTNPLLASSMTEFSIGGLTSFGVFGFDWNFRAFAIADAVVSWQTSKDGLYDKVVLRDDLVWSDGHPITAHDVEFSFKVIMTEAVPIPAVRSGTDKLKMVKAYDDRTLVYFHQKPLVTNIWNVNFPVIPKHVFEATIPNDPTLVDSDTHVELEERPLSGGAYVIASRSPTEVVLERRDGYYMFDGQQVRNKPYFKTVRFRINPDGSTALLGMKAGDVDLMQLEAAQWSSQTNDEEFYEKATKARDIQWVSFSFFWNTKSPFFSDARVREALSYAFDHDEMLQTLRYGRDEPCTGTYHRASPWHPGADNAIKNVPQPLTQDRERAKRLLDEAGWVDNDGDGYRDKEIDGQRRKFEFSVIVRNQKERVDICELLKQNLRPIGISVNIRPLEGATLQDKMFKREFDAAYGGWGTGADPDTSENIWGTGQDRNYVSYSNPYVDEMFAEGRKLPQDRKFWKDLKLWQDEATREYLGIDPNLADARPERADCYAAIQAILWRDKPYTWLFYRNAYYAFSKKLRGYNFSPRGPFNYGPGFRAIWSPSDL